MIDALVTGSAQAVEWPFSATAYTDLLTLNPPNGCQAFCAGSNQLYMGTVGAAFNYAAFPGNDLNFRRAFSFLQNYEISQGDFAFLSGYGVQASDLAACPPLPTGTCSTPDPMAIYNTATLLPVQQELEQVGSYSVSGSSQGPNANTVWCVQSGGSPCGNTMSSTNAWCQGASMPTYTNCKNAPWTFNLIGRKTLFRNDWATFMGGDLLSLGLSITVSLDSGGAADAACFVPNAGDVSSPGSYVATGPDAGYNTDPTFNGNAAAAEASCPIYTWGFISTGPSIVELESYTNSQGAGTSTISTGNTYDDPTWVTPTDSAFSSAANTMCAVPHTFANNVQYDDNAILYAPTVAAAQTQTQSLEIATACQADILPGYYLNEPMVTNFNGWTGVVQEPGVGGTELGGIYWTLMNVHQCGSATCTLGATNGGTLGGTYSYNPEYTADGGFGFNPTYSGNWVWQAVVLDEFYDSAFVTGPTQFSQIATLLNPDSFTSYMVSIYNDQWPGNGVPAGYVTGTGATWFYFQQPCGNVIATCQGHANPSQTPGPKQRGVGLTVAQRTLGSDYEVMTLTFKNNIYFYDGQKVTAWALVDTIDAFNEACSPNYPQLVAPGTCSAGGPNGLIAAHVTNNGMTVALYFGLRAAWNLGDLTLILPPQVLKYFNIDEFSTATVTCDLTGPYSYALHTSCPLATPSTALPATSYLNYMGNVNFGSGPFILSNAGCVTGFPSGSCYNANTGAGQLDANPYYFNSNWQATATFNQAPGSSYSFTAQHIYEIYNPGSSPITCGPATPAAIPSHGWGNCELTTPYASIAHGTVLVYTSTGILVRDLKLGHDTCPGASCGTYYAESWNNIPGIALNAASVNGGETGCVQTTIGGNCPALSPGQYEIVIQASFTFKVPGTTSTSTGATWYQQSGFTVP